MDSLHLPPDLFWDGKMEPTSPTSSELFSLSNSEESWLFNSTIANDISLLTDDDKNITLDHEIEGELVYEFEFDIKKEQWLDVKPNAQPMDIESYVPQPQPNDIQIVKLQNTCDLIMELENLYNVAELTQLTPPQTPPQEASDIKEIFDFITQHSPPDVQENTVIDEIIPVPSPASSYGDYSSDTTNSPVPSEVAHGSQIVDEIVRTRAKDLPDFNDEDTMYSTSSSSASQSNDTDWLPSESSPSGKACLSGVTKKRVRPYGRGIEDKKSRKKEQNKNAATRYRQKKKQEMEIIQEEERELLKTNEELTKNVREVQREVKYLKQLIKEFYKL